MKIAVSGAHRTGKTTLIEELVRALPAYVAVDEPYYALADEGLESAEMPGLDDFERQLERSIEFLAEAEGNRFFDRCPADIVAYLITHHDADGFDIEHWLPRIQSAMGRLDLIVFVPVEHPDRLPVSGPGDTALRRRVDEELREILLDDRWGFGVELLEVTGPLDERVRQVMACIRGGEA